MKLQIFFAALIIVLFSISISAQKSYPKYEGKPETDSRFVNFIKKNLGKTVYLSLSIKDGGWISEGYRGVQPYFKGKKTARIDYSFFLECESDEKLSPIEECKEAIWSENVDGSGVLSGYFKVSRIIKTSLRNYRAVFLIPIKV